MEFHALRLSYCDLRTHLMHVVDYFVTKTRTGDELQYIERGSCHVHFGLVACPGLVGAAGFFLFPGKRPKTFASGRALARLPSTAMKQPTKTTHTITLPIPYSCRKTQASSSPLVGQAEF